MNKKLKLFLSIVIIVQFFFCIKSNAMNSNSNSNQNYTNEQMAIQEVANAYFRKDSNIQYESMKRDYLLSPEEATEDCILNTTCHTFAYQIYKQAFNIEIPKGCSEAFEYCKIKEGTEYVPIFYHTENFTNTSSDYSKEATEYKELLSVFYNGNNEEDPLYLNFISKLEVGDIITERRRTPTKTSDHTMIVESFMYDNLGNRTNCIIIESNYGKTLNIEDDNYSTIGGLASKNEDKLEQYGSINKRKLSSVLKRYASAYFNDSRKPICLAAWRPLGNHNKYCYISMDNLKEHNKNNMTNVQEEYQNIKLTNATKSRMKYQGIDINKTGSQHTNTIVGLGDEITYNIRITNNGNTSYEGLTIKEYFASDLVDCDLKNQNNSNGKTELRWDNIHIDAGKSINIEYTVKVRENINNLNKNIISEGMIDDIELPKIINTISVKLSEDEKIKLIENANNINYKGYTNGLQLISDLYSNSFDYDLNLKNGDGNFLKASDIIKVNESKNNEIINNKLSKIILKDFYGTWIASNKVTDSSRYYIWGTAEDEVGDQNAKTITKGNLNIGDIILIENDNTESAYIYLGNKIIGANEIIYETKNVTGKYDTQDPITKFLADLVSKDVFVILSPAIYNDITETQLEIEYDKKELTSDDVTVTIKSNEKILGVDGWTLSLDKKSLSKQFSNNAEESLIVYDYGGNKKEIEIKIDNIDKVKPQIDISYSTTKTTNQNVIVTIKSNEKLKNVNGWILSEDKKTLTRTYSENKYDSVEVTDLAGNNSIATIDIKNIDKQKPIIEIIYSTKEQTSNNVMVSINANEELQEVEGWQLSDDKKTLNKTYTNNTDEKIIIYDLAGNSITETIKVDNISIGELEYELKYSTTLITNGDVIVTITANEKIQNIEGWILSENGKVLTKIFSENTEEVITIKDLEGNNSRSTTIKINNIDKTKPRIKINYSTTDNTNQDIIVTINANEDIKEIEGWSLSTDKKELTKKIASNTEEKITISDLAGNTISDIIKVNNIDKEPPKIEIKYSTTSTTPKEVTVTIISDKVIKKVDGWTLSNDKKQLTKRFIKNVEEKITVNDEYGNSTIANIKISNINMIEEKQVDMNENSYYDSTKASGILPQTGEKRVLGLVAIFIIISVILYRKLKKYKI